MSFFFADDSSSEESENSTSESLSFHHSLRNRRKNAFSGSETEKISREEYGNFSGSEDNHHHILSSDPNNFDKHLEAEFIDRSFRDQEEWSDSSSEWSFKTEETSKSTSSSFLKFIPICDTTPSTVDQMLKISNPFSNSSDSESSSSSPPPGWAFPQMLHSISENNLDYKQRRSPTKLPSMSELVSQSNDYVYKPKENTPTSNNLTFQSSPIPRSLLRSTSTPILTPDSRVPTRPGVTRTSSQQHVVQKTQSSDPYSVGYRNANLPPRPPPVQGRSTSPKPPAPSELKNRVMAQIGASNNVYLPAHPQSPKTQQGTLPPKQGEPKSKRKRKWKLKNSTSSSPGQNSDSSVDTSPISTPDLSSRSSSNISVSPTVSAEHLMAALSCFDLPSDSRIAEVETSEFLLNQEENTLGRNVLMEKQRDDDYSSEVISTLSPHPIEQTSVPSSSLNTLKSTSKPRQDGDVRWKLGDLKDAIQSIKKRL